MVEGGNIKGRKKVEEKVKFTITKKKKLLALCLPQELWPPAAHSHHHAE